MRYLFLLIAITLSSFKISAQTKELSLIEINQHVKDNFYKNYHPDSIALSKLCRRACIFTKFRVNEQGMITELSFSKDSISFIKEALINAVNSLKNDQALITALKKSGKTVIQPIIYYYQAGCSFSKQSEIDTILKDQSNNKNKKSDLEIRDEMEYFGATLSDMLNFSDGKLKAIDCILLSPCEVASGSIY